MGRHTGARGLIAYHGEQPATIAGPALTVRIRPGDNLMIHLAIMTAEPGDVIVIDGGGDLSTAVIGGLMRTRALARGLDCGHRRSDAHQRSCSRHRRFRARRRASRCRRVEGGRRWCLRARQCASRPEQRRSRCT
ncbi:hypothetical protein [Sinorhizobium medicae]|uniref:RraA family protein n=1 Tax=Sinorhizobium medicae TaxID=110321 RepID=UPI003C73CFA7